MSYKEARYRSVIKAISWRILATTATITIVYVFTRKLILSLEVGAVEVIAKMILYYFHERTWGRVQVGKKEHPLSPIKLESSLNKSDIDAIKEKIKEAGYVVKD